MVLISPDLLPLLLLVRESPNLGTCAHPQLSNSNFEESSARAKDLIYATNIHTYSQIDLCVISGVITYKLCDTRQVI